MTTGAAITAGHVNPMAEYHVSRSAWNPGILDRTGRRMAFVATAGGFEGGTAVVTSTAGFSTLHVRHGVALCPLPGSKDTVMAIGARISLQMKLVAEPGTRWLEGDLLDRVTFIAGGLDAESSTAVMTSAARFTFFHFSHGAAPGSHPAEKDAVVAVAAFIHAGMDLVAEADRPGLRGSEDDIGGAFMALVAIPLHAEGAAAIVTGSARIAPLHVRH